MNQVLSPRVCGRADIVARLDVERQAAHQASHARRAGDGDGQNDHEIALAQRSNEDQVEHDARERDQRIQHLHDPLVGPAAAIAGVEPQDRAQQQRTEHAPQRDAAGQIKRNRLRQTRLEQDNLRAHHHARQDVAAQVIRAQPVHGVRRQILYEELRVGRVRRPEERDKCDNEPEQHDSKPNQSPRCESKTSEKSFHSRRSRDGRFSRSCCRLCYCHRQAPFTLRTALLRRDVFHLSHRIASRIADPRVQERVQQVADQPCGTATITISMAAAATAL